MVVGNRDKSCVDQNKNPFILIQSLEARRKLLFNFEIFTLKYY